MVDQHADAVGRTAAQLDSSLAELRQIVSTDTKQTEQTRAGLTEQLAQIRAQARMQWPTQAVCSLQ